MSDDTIIADGLEAAFFKIMSALRELSTERSRLIVINWAYEAFNEREGPLSDTGKKQPLPPLPGALFGVRHKDILLRQRFLSEAAANNWALNNYKGNDVFTVVQIIPGESP